MYQKHLNFLKSHKFGTITIPFKAEEFEVQNEVKKYIL